MSVSMTAGDIESPARAKSWANRLRSTLRPAMLCDLLVVGLLVCWAGSRLDLIVHHGLVGGCGDESHRLILSHRLCHDFSANIYPYFFERPWPTLPYILQSALFRLQRGLGFSADYGTVAVVSSTCAYLLAVALAYAALSLRFQRVAGFIAVVMLFSLHEMTTLAITPMAESYSAFFLALAIFFAALPQASFRNAVLIGLAVMLATQCRSEMIALSIVFGLYCLHRSGWLAAAACFSTAVAPFALKVIVNRATGFSGMTYFNLAQFVHFENSWHANAMKALGALEYYGQLELASDRLAGFAVLVAICAAIACQTAGAPRSRSGLRSGYFALLFGAAAALSVSIFLAMAGSMVLTFPRYFVTCHFLWVIPLAAVVSAPLARLGALFAERAERWQRLRQSRLCAVRLAISLACVVLMAGSLYRGAEHFSKIAVSLYKEQCAHIPPAVLSAKEWMRENYRQEHVCFDSLMWWETYLFFHNMRSDSLATQFMVYDQPPGDWNHGPQPERSENLVAATHRYIESIRPQIIVLAGPEFRQALEKIESFCQYDEKPSYLRPYLTERENGELELSNSPFWNPEAPLTVTLRPAFENEAVAIYRASYSSKR